MAHLVIVDGHHLLYRAYWAIPRTMRTSKGEQVNIAFGLASMLLQILKTEEPDSMLFCFDADEDTFRHIEYKEYKAGRSATPEDFYPQVPRALQVIDAFGIKSVSGSKMEADDFAASYAVAAEAKGDQVTIVSGDRDLLQLATDKIRIAIPHKGYNAAEYMGPKQILDKYGVTPAQITSYKGLVGDSSDNLPGVHGIGPKAGSALIAQYGSVAAIYENIASIKAAWREKLEKDKEQAFFCERMATLVRDIPLSVPLQDLLLSSIDTKPIVELFGEMDFTLVMRRLQALLLTEYGKQHFVGGAPILEMNAGFGSSVSSASKSKMKESFDTEVAQLSLL